MRFPPGLLLFLSFFLLPASSGSVEVTSESGIRMTVQIGFATARFNKNESQYTLYIGTDRKRMEYQNATGGGVHADGTVDMRPGPRLASITRCDLGQTFDLNLEDREYVVSPYTLRTLTRIGIATRDLSVPGKIDSATPTVRIETTTVDTGERKELFGRLARHVITTSKQTPLAGSHAESQETVTDGWYIDLDTSITCDVKWPVDKRSQAHLRAGPLGEKYEFVDKGNAETGFAVERKTRWRSGLTTPDGTKTEIAYTSELKTTEFTEGRLDPALFEISPSFRKVNDINRNPPLTLADRWFYTQAWFRAVARSIFK
jgi:hypothetical protein